MSLVFILIFITVVILLQELKIGNVSILLPELRGYNADDWISAFGSEPPRWLTPGRITAFPQHGIVSGYRIKKNPGKFVKMNNPHRQAWSIIIR